MEVRSHHDVNDAENRYNVAELGDHQNLLRIKRAKLVLLIPAVERTSD